MDLEIDPALLGLSPPPGTGQQCFWQEMQQLSAVPAGGSVATAKGQLDFQLM